MRRVAIAAAFLFGLLPASAGASSIVSPVARFHSETVKEAHLPLGRVLARAESCSARIWNYSSTQKIAKTKGSKSKLAFEDAAITFEINQLGSYFLRRYFNKLLALSFELGAFSGADQAVNQASVGQSAYLMGLLYLRGQKLDTCAMLMQWRKGAWSKTGQQKTLAKARGFSLGEMKTQQQSLDSNQLLSRSADSQLLAKGLTPRWLEMWQGFPYFTMFAALSPA